jgi:hypothetical protein
MQSLWLRIEHVDQDTGRIALFDVVFPGQQHEPIVAKPFPLAMMHTPGWTAREAAIASTPGPSPNLFDDYGDDLRKLLEPSVLAEWASRRTNCTRTYLDVRRSDFPPPQAGGQPVRQLADLRWEYLAEKKRGGYVDRYFADRKKPMLRAFGSRASAAGGHRQQLVVLIVTGEPIDWKAGGFPGDDMGAVLREIQSSTTCAYAELLQAPLLARLEGALDRLNPDIVHFSGHGELSADTGRPALRISTPGQAWWWDHTNIQAFFANREYKPRLVVLNACDSATAAGEFHSVLEALMEAGIPSVLAAQAPIRQAVTSELSQVFYRHLLAGQPIDMAAIEARIQIGQDGGGAGWQWRDWGLPVLNVAAEPEAVFPPKPVWNPDPVTTLQHCAVLKEFMRDKGLPAPFVGLGWPEQRWMALEALRRSHCLVIKGPRKGGKSWLVMRTLRDAVHIGHRVKYVAVCGGPNSAVNYINLLSAIANADNTRIGSEVHKALDPACFVEFRDAIAAKRPPDRIVAAFERGLQDVTKDHELTIVLDEFQRDGAVAESLPPSEFREILLPLWLKIARGAIRNLRLIIVVREDLYDKYDLGVLPGEPVKLELFKQSDVPMLFQELCRFYRKPQIDTLCEAAQMAVSEPQWDATWFEWMGRLVRSQQVP